MYMCIFLCVYAYLQDVVAQPSQGQFVINAHLQLSVCVCAYLQDVATQPSQGQFVINAHLQLSVCVCAYLQDFVIQPLQGQFAINAHEQLSVCMRIPTGFCHTALTGSICNKCTWTALCVYAHTYRILLHSLTGGQIFCNERYIIIYL